VRTISGNILRFSPDTLHFAQMADIFVRFDTLDLALCLPTTQLILGRWNEVNMAWESIPCVVDTASGIITGQTDKLGIFAPIFVSWDTTTGVEEDADAGEKLPANPSLSQNYPNPFNQGTEIKYALPKSCNVSLTIYNLLGQKVRTLVNEYQNAGYKSAFWDGKDESGKDVSSGIYFYLLKTDDFKEAKKMTIIK
jgi:hypothetical protein